MTGFFVTIFIILLIAIVDLYHQISMKRGRKTNKGILKFILDNRLFIRSVFGMILFSVLLVRAIIDGAHPLVRGIFSFFLLLSIMFMLLARPHK